MNHTVQNQLQYIIHLNPPNNAGRATAVVAIFLPVTIRDKWTAINGSLILSPYIFYLSVI